MEPIILLVTHVDFTQDSLSLAIKSPLITIYGNTMDSNPIQVQISDFLPYMYAETCHSVNASSLERAIVEGYTKAKCMGVQKVMKQSIYGYSDKQTPFYKIFFNNPFAMKGARSLLENGIVVDKINMNFKTYESTFPYVLRFMNDTGITGMSYIKLNNYKIINNEASDKKFAVSTDSALIEPLPIEGEFMKILPLKIMSIDIECCSSSDAFPIPSKDPVIQIGNTVQRFGGEHLNKDIFCLKDTADIPGANVRWFDDEKDLLQAWRDYLIAEDPDIIIGYNIKGFDFPYLLERAETLGINSFGKLGRSSKISKVITKQQSSSAFGSFDAKDISIDGRLIFDLLHIIRRDHRLRSYSLNSVSYHFLKEQKEDVSHSSMNTLQNGTRETRRRIASYCLRDTYLPMRLFDKLNILINNSELARATHVPIEFFSSRGAAIKVLSQIYHEAGKSGYLIPDMGIQSGTEGFEGAFVMEPIKGFYSEPIAVMDFSSLYPSIIISKNMCYTTLLSKEQYITLGGTKSPSNDCFCSSNVKEGLLPRILKNLLVARKETKNQLKTTTDPFLKRSLDGRQLALKICANSIYGFTGSPTGQLLCVEISQSTTAFGRDMIAQTKELIETNYNVGKGYDFNAHYCHLWRHGFCDDQFPQTCSK